MRAIRILPRSFCSPRRVWPGWAGSGKLSAISLTDTSPLSLTTAQQSDGAAMLAALLPGATIVSLD